MNLYLIENPKYCYGYDEYDSAVVCAKSSKGASKIHPGGYADQAWEKDPDEEWPHPDLVNVTYLGKAASKMKRGVICASYNAG